MGAQDGEPYGRAENRAVGQDLGDRAELGAEQGLGTGQTLGGVQNWETAVVDRALKKGQGLQETSQKLGVYMIGGQERAKGKELGEGKG